MADLYSVGNAHVYMAKIAQSADISYSLAGRLQLSSGWIVLPVPAALIRGAFDAIHEQGIELPKSFSIPVITPDEIAQIGHADKITERGHSFHYTLGPVRSHGYGREISKTWYIEIYSPELKRLRHSYNLSTYPKGLNSFQLPIAIRKTKVIHDSGIAKTSECLSEPDWSIYDPETIKF